MKLSESIKSISYLKNNAAEMIRTIHEKRQPYIITQNGEAKAVVQDIKEYERTQETLAMLKLLSMSKIDEGTKSLQEAFAEVEENLVKKKKIHVK